MDEPTAPESGRPGPTHLERPQLLKVALTGFTQVSAGRWFNCGLRADGSIYCWGGLTFTRILKAAAGVFTQISSGGLHLCALRSDGAIQCWGYNILGQAPAVRTAAVGHYILVSAGDSHTCALRNDSVVECWGSNGYGEGAPTYTPRLPFFDLSASDNGNCGISYSIYITGGVVDCWGQDAQLIDASDGARFEQVATRPYWADGEMCAVRNDGFIECVAFSSSGILNRTKRVPGAGAFIHVAVGKAVNANFGCGARTDGIVQCWGYNGDGEAPAARAPLSGKFTQVAAGMQHTCALRDDGAVECWGLNHLGQAPPLVTDTLYPVATFAFDTVVDEGGTFTLSLTGAHVPGYDGAPFRTFLDCGVYPFSTEDTTKVCSAVEGPWKRLVLGVVRDRDGEQTIYHDSVRIRNVAPAVAPLQGAQLLVTETWYEQGSFTDPGIYDTHTASADWGDGTPVGAPAVTGTTFVLDHQYRVPGAFTAQVTVRDDDGDAGTAAGTVSVMSFAEFIGGLEAEIDLLVAKSILAPAEGRTLKAKLDRLLVDLTAGRKVSAARFIELFRNQVQGLLDDGSLTPSEGDPLLAAADRLAVALTNL